VFPSFLGLPLNATTFMLFLPVEFKRKRISTLNAILAAKPDQSNRVHTTESRRVAAEPYVISRKLLSGSATMRGSGTTTSSVIVMSMPNGAL